jgi:hypothetical protein
MLDLVRTVLVEAIDQELDPYSSSGPAASTSPARGAREAFLLWLGEGGAGVQAFLEVGICMGESGRLELRNWADLGLAPPDLRAFTDPADAEFLGSRTGGGAHRPLRSAPDLARGWRITGLDADGVWEALRHLYPGAAVHSGLGSGHGPKVIPFETTTGRQGGRYAGVGELSASVIAEAVEVRCGTGCLRTPLWEPGQALVSVRGRRSVPCLEVCPALLSALRKARS